MLLSEVGGMMNKECTEKTVYVKPKVLDLGALTTLYGGDPCLNGPGADGTCSPVGSSATGGSGISCTDGGAASCGFGGGAAT